jgi:hypothetical protein
LLKLFFSQNASVSEICKPLETSHNILNGRRWGRRSRGPAHNVLGIIEPAFGVPHAGKTLSWRFRHNNLLRSPDVNFFDDQTTLLPA